VAIRGAARADQPPARAIVTAESSFAVQWLRQRYPHLDVLQAEHAPHWLFHQSERRPQNRPLHFLHVGAPSLIKGSDLVLQALDKLRHELDFRLTLVSLPEPALVDRLKAATLGRALGAGHPPL